MFETERDERNHERLSPALAELEASLSDLTPAGGLNRDELLFEAGRRAALPQNRTGIGFWKSLSAALAVMLAAQTLLLWPAEDESSADTPIADRGREELPVDRSPSDGESMVNSALPPDLRAPLVVDEADETSRGGAQYLRLRRLALSEGVDAVDLQPSAKSDQPSESGATRREFLRELLGS
ncbi:MAG: hypothetical protein H8E37_03135 [Planctomycetes bacterium]|nr:hypothetical protein [Planctomycetota bacterium]